MGKTYILNVRPFQDAVLKYGEAVYVKYIASVEPEGINDSVSEAKDYLRSLGASDETMENFEKNIKRSLWDEPTKTDVRTGLLTRSLVLEIMNFQIDRALSEGFTHITTIEEPISED